MKINWDERKKIKGKLQTSVLFKLENNSITVTQFKKAKFALKIQKDQFVCENLLDTFEPKRSQNWNFGSVSTSRRKDYSRIKNIYLVPVSFTSKAYHQISTSLNLLQ